MTRMINKPADVVSQVLNGVAYIHQDKMVRVPKSGIMMKKNLDKDKVSLISGGGSGHEPAHFGFIGEGMLDATVSGPIFTPPTSKEIVEAIKHVDQGQGTLLIIKNFEADKERFLEAESQAKELGYEVSHVIVNDDCSIEVESHLYQKRRRGVAGVVFTYKILGQAAKEGMTLEALVSLGKEVVGKTNSLGVAFSSGTHIQTHEHLFDMKENMISFGIGIHGESGYREEAFVSSEYLANELVNKLLSQYPDNKGPLAILINSLGSTTAMEQYVFANDVNRLLTLENNQSLFQKCGEFMTSMDMKGISLSVLQLSDLTWLSYLEKTTDAFAW